MSILHAAFPLDPSTRADAVDLVEDLVEQSQAEEGMIDYRAATDISDPNVVRFFERYEDAAAFEAHSRTDHFQEFEARLPGLLAGEPDGRRFEVESATELDL